MAVYTDITDAELEALLARYDLGRARAFKGIAEGIENSNFLLETDAGRFILTVYERRVRADDLPFFLELKRWLAGRGFPCPTPVAARDGALLGEVRGKPCAIVTFLPGLSVRDPDATHCRAAGEGLARLHAAGEGFALARANALGPGAWRPLLEAHAALADRLRPGLAAQARADLDALEREWLRDPPTGVIHADLFPDNVFFDGAAFVGAIDFYFACIDALAYDLAVMLVSWAFPGHRLDPFRARALVAGYEAVRPLAPSEHAALGLFARGAAMRFFLTRLADWEATPPGALVQRKDPLEYAARLDQLRALADRPLMEALGA